MILQTDQNKEPIILYFNNDENNIIYLSNMSRSREQMAGENLNWNACKILVCLDQTIAKLYVHINSNKMVAGQEIVSFFTIYKLQIFHNSSNHINLSRN